MSIFKPEEIKERRNRDGSVSVFPIVGGRLRLAHETNDQLSITTELVTHAPMEGATVKAADRSHRPAGRWKSPCPSCCRTPRISSRPWTPYQTMPEPK